MIWAIALLGLALTVLGATAAAALITSSRTQLTNVVARRLRGGAESLAWLPPLERDLAAASVTSTLGIAMLGAVFPAMFAGARLMELALLLVIVALPTVLLSGYLLPRLLTRHRAPKVAERLQPLLRPWSAVLGVILPAPSVQPEVMITELWRERAAAGHGPDEQLLRMGGVISFSQRSVREVMTPRTELVAIPEEASGEEVRQAFIQSGYTRLPVYRGSLDEIAGMVHAFDLFRLKPGDPLPVRSVAVAPAGRPCGDVLLDMQRERRHLAVVLDEFGGTLGIVTLEDLLEALVGEIVGEEPLAEPAAAAGPELLEAEGSTPVAEIEARFGIELPPGQASSIGGRLVELAGRFPAPGERFLVRGLELDVLLASATRVERLLVRRGSPQSIPLDKSGA
ncbi:MAG TPA: CBS domain-containing protein [Gemmatimonadales bacterium]|jgi:CBS domain containing-hemolysin-like protein|nr:CBS domain-containing protein [Gemmatimonadales bacterium]